MVQYLLLRSGMPIGQLHSRGGADNGYYRLILGSWKSVGESTVHHVPQTLNSTRNVSNCRPPLSGRHENYRRLCCHGCISFPTCLSQLITESCVAVCQSRIGNVGLLLRHKFDL